MSAGFSERAAVRSYQRIFRPERRIYQVEGHRIPVPGGVPLAWLAYTIATLLAVLLLSSRSLTLGALLALGAGVAGLAIGGRTGALAAAAATLAGTQIVGFLLATVDWPLRLVVVPALVATLGMQATPDGRPVHRYALSWIALQLRPVRRSLGRPLPGAGEPRRLDSRLWVAADEHAPVLRRGRISGPASVRFPNSLLVGTSPPRGSRRRVGRPPAARRRPRGATVVYSVELTHGERLEVRP